MPERLLSILREAGEKGVSGPSASKTLGITRAAVWKKMALLRARGFEIEGSKGGYRLVGSPELSREELSVLLPGKKIIFRTTVPSTNDLAACLGEEKWFLTGSEDVLVVADAQSSGKGRLGRRWSSPSGLNIYMSSLFKPHIPPRAVPLLSLAAALAAALAIKAQTGLDVRLKWPNDLVARGKKLGGVLIEARSDPDRVLFAVAGIGVNVNSQRGDFPASLRRTATSVFIETGVRASRSALTAAICKELDHWMDSLKKGEAATLLRSYRALSSTIGSMVVVHAEGKRFEGIAKEVDEEGRLVLSTAGGKELRFSAGDVFMIRGRQKR